MHRGAVEGGVREDGGVDEEEEAEGELGMALSIEVCRGRQQSVAYECARQVDACCAGVCAVKPFWFGEAEEALGGGHCGRTFGVSF